MIHMAYTIIRQVKLKDQSQIDRWDDYGEHLLEIPDVDSNADWEKILPSLAYDNPVTEIRHRIEDVKEDENRVYSNSIKAVIVLLTATPSFYDEASTEEERDAKFEEWLSRAKQFLQNEYGRRLVDGWIHRDPSVPHVHALFTPTIREDDPEAQENQSGTRLCYGDLYGTNSKKPSSLEERYISYFQELGLSAVNTDKSLRELFNEDGTDIDSTDNPEILKDKLRQARETLSDPERLLKQLFNDETFGKLNNLAEDPVEFVRQTIDRQLKIVDPDHSVHPDLIEEVPPEHLEVIRGNAGEPWDSFYDPGNDVGYHFLGDEWQITKKTSYGKLTAFEVGNGEIRRKVFGQTLSDLSAEERGSLPEPD